MTTIPNCELCNDYFRPVEREATWRLTTETGEFFICTPHYWQAQERHYRGAEFFELEKAEA